MADPAVKPSVDQDTVNPFITSTSLAKPNEATRKLIRSHVMRGKNVRKPVGAASSLKPGSRPHENEDNCQGRNELPRVRTEFSGSGLSVVRFAAETTPYMRDRILTFFRLKARGIYPIETCVVLDPMISTSFQYLQFDVLFLHSLVWAMQTFLDRLQNTPNSRDGMMQGTKTLNLLRERLTHQALATSDVTISVVATLVTIASATRDLEAARKHMTGLSKMISLRGGLKTLKENPQAQLKVYRADLTVALLHGTKPFFFPTNTDHQSFLSKARRPKKLQQVSILNIDLRLSSIWTDLKNFCTLANLASQKSEQKISLEFFEELLISTEYHLIRLELSAENILVETLRLSMLAFSSTVFLQPPGLRLRLDYLARGLQGSIVDESFDQIPHDMQLWILFVASMSAVTGQDDHWIIPLLKSIIRVMEIDTWEEVREVMKRILWIDALHNRPGKILYEKI